MVNGWLRYADSFLTNRFFLWRNRSMPVSCSTSFSICLNYDYYKVNGFSRQLTNSSQLLEVSIEIISNWYLTGIKYDDFFVFNKMGEGRWVLVRCCLSQSMFYNHQPNPCVTRVTKFDLMGGSFVYFSKIDVVFWIGLGHIVSFKFYNHEKTHCII